MLRICTALLRSVAISLGLPYEIVEPLAQSLNSDYEKVRFVPLREKKCKHSMELDELLMMEPHF